MGVGRTVEDVLLGSWPRLYGYALSLSGEPDTARDLVQQAALNALAAGRRPSDDRAVRAWLFKIVRNAWIDQRRRAAVREMDAEPEALDGVWTFDDRLIGEITVREGLLQIEPIHREVVELVDLHGFTYEETAEVLDVPIGTVMSRISRARIALLRAIEGGKVRPFAPPRRRTR